MSRAADRLRLDGPRRLAPRSREVANPCCRIRCGPLAEGRSGEWWGTGRHPRVARICCGGCPQPPRVDEVSGPLQPAIARIHAAYPRIPEVLATLSARGRLAVSRTSRSLRLARFVGARAGGSFLARGCDRRRGPWPRKPIPRAFVPLRCGPRRSHRHGSGRRLHDRFQDRAVPVRGFARSIRIWIRWVPSQELAADDQSCTLPGISRAFCRN